MRGSYFPLRWPYKVKYAGDNFTKRAKKISDTGRVSVDRFAGKCFHSNFFFFLFLEGFSFILLFFFFFFFSNVSGADKKYRVS